MIPTIVAAWIAADVSAHAQVLIFCSAGDSYVLLGHDWFMETPHDRHVSPAEYAAIAERIQRGELEKVRAQEQMRDAEAREAETANRLRELFNDPGQAAEVLGQSSSLLDAPGGISTILLDNSTIAHALRYFGSAHREGSPTKLPARSRLMLLAVADFVNAVILHENVLAGPDSRVSTYALPKLPPNVLQSVSGRLPKKETFAVFALAKETAAKATREQEVVDAISALLGTSLSAEEVLHRVTAIPPFAAHTSADAYYNGSTPLLNILGPSRRATGPAREQADGYQTRDENLHPTLYEWGLHPKVGPVEFAAHLIFRTHVYLYLADLIGCPYGADALRKNLLPPQSRCGFAERITTLVGEAQNNRDDQVNDLLGFEAFKVRMPLVLKSVLSRASTPSEILEITLETRESRAARRFREYCARVDIAIDEGKRDDVARAFAELSSYGVQLESDLQRQRTDGHEAVQAAKELVGVGSPLLGALIPGLAIVAGKVSHQLRRRKFAFIEQLSHTPRNLNDIEREFAGLWPGL